MPRFRRRPLRFFPDAPQSDGPLSIGDELDKLARSVSDPYARKVSLWHRPFPPVTTDGNTRNSPKLFVSEMQSFLAFYSRYLADTAEEEALYEIFCD